MVRLLLLWGHLSLPLSVSYPLPHLYNQRLPKTPFDGLLHLFPPGALLATATVTFSTCVFHLHLSPLQQLTRWGCQGRGHRPQQGGLCGFSEASQPQTWRRLGARRLGQRQGAARVLSPVPDKEGSLGLRRGEGERLCGLPGPFKRTAKRERKHGRAVCPSEGSVLHRTAESGQP